MRIYTDASTRGRISGIAFVATDAKDRELYKKGVVIEQRDNNTAELCAVLFALEDIKYLKFKHVPSLRTHGMSSMRSEMVSEGKMKKALLEEFVSIWLKSIAV